MIYNVRFSGLRYPLTSSFSPKRGESVLCEINGEHFIGDVGLPVKAELQITGRILRPVYNKEKDRVKDMKKDEEYAYRFCSTRIEYHKLPMKLLGVDKEWNGKRYKFYFLANSRVDFRDLVADLKEEFEVTIELRQIGVRDYAASLGGFGLCGRPFCCTRFLNEKQSIPLEFAKDQDIYVDPSKVSGPCGRLLCCLSYEHDFYKKLKEKFPERGEEIMTEKGSATVQHRSMLMGILTVKYKDEIQEEIPVEHLARKGDRWISIKKEE